MGKKNKAKKEAAKADKKRNVKNEDVAVPVNEDTVAPEEINSADLDLDKEQPVGIEDDESPDNVQKEISDLALEEPGVGAELSHDDHEAEAESNHDDHEVDAESNHDEDKADAIETDDLDHWEETETAPHHASTEDDDFATDFAGEESKPDLETATEIKSVDEGASEEEQLGAPEDINKDPDQVVETADSQDEPTNETIEQEEHHDFEASLADEHEDSGSALLKTSEETSSNVAQDFAPQPAEELLHESETPFHATVEEAAEGNEEKDIPTEIHPESNAMEGQFEDPEHQPPVPVQTDTAGRKKLRHRNREATHGGPAPLPSPTPSEPRSAHSPAQSAGHPQSRHGSPMMYHTSPQYRYANPAMQAYNHYVAGMHGAPMYPASVHHGSVVAPSSPSYATAYQTPMIEHTPMASPHMYPRRSSTYANGARDYYTGGRMDRTLSNGSGHSHSHSQRLERTESQNINEEDHHEHHHLMGRVEKAMPDITRMLDSFKETRNKLQAREAEARQLQIQHEQAIMHKDFYIDALQNQMKKAATEAAEEYGKFRDVINNLRKELSNQQARIKELEEYLDTSRKENEELENKNSKVEEEVQSLRKMIEEIQLNHERVLEEAKEHERMELAAQKEELTNLFEEIRAEDEAAASERYNEREKELLEQQETIKSELEERNRNLEESHKTVKSELEAALDQKHADLEKTLSDLETAKNDLESVHNALTKNTEDLELKEKELDAAKTELDSKVAELEKTQNDLHYKHEELQATQTELQSTLEELVLKKAELEGKHSELEQTRNRHAEEKGQLIGSHFTELDNIRDGYAKDIANMRNTHKATLSELETRFEMIIKNYEEKERTWAAEKSMLQRQLHEKLDELAGIEREKDALERDDVVREKHLQSAVEEMRRTIDNMENDRDKLRRTLQSLGEATDLKTSKGDQFFVDSFSQLRRLIVELSQEHFFYLPIDPPKDILEKIPPEMPSFLDNTVASRELRSAYIQHVVSKTLTYRIFQPFLFTLGRRYDKADTFFQVLSMDIRRKSVRREAFWRQQTLKAAYTTSDAKQSINVVAAVIVDEIVDHIKHFADPQQLDALLTGVRKIVKLAAETWRHARVERELVLATMPAPESDGEVNEGWEEYTGSHPATTSTSKPSGATRHILLRVFPRIYREAAHEDFADDKEKMEACVYFPGSILYSDSAPVLARREEQNPKPERQARSN